MWPRSVRDEDGIAMATVIVLAAVLFALTTIMVMRSGQDLNQARGDRLFERAVHVAESGVDYTLFRISADSQYTTGDTPPAFASRADEKAWVLTTAAAPVKTATATGGGEWVAIKPTNASIVYAVGYVPSRASAQKTRLVRVQYDFAPFPADIALLSDGNIELSGNPALGGTKGSAHGNGNVTVTGVGPTVSGYLAASGTYSVPGSFTPGDPANSGGGKPQRRVPTVDARTMYPRSQYDLCPTGQVRAGPAYPGPEAPGGTTPCSGTALGDANASEYRGWRKSGGGAVWNYTGNVAYNGIYYVYQGSADVSGGPGSDAAPWEVTIVAEAVSAGGAEPNCPHTEGDVTFRGGAKVRNHPGVPPVIAAAGRDLDFGGTPGATYQGAFLAHEQFRAGGDPSLTGTVVVDDACNTAGSPVSATLLSGNARITYNGGLEIPGSDIRAALWLEL